MQPKCSAAIIWDAPSALLNRGGDTELHAAGSPSQAVPNLHSRPMKRGHHWCPQLMCADVLSRPALTLLEKKSWASICHPSKFRLGPLVGPALIITHVSKPTVDKRQNKSTFYCLPFVFFRLVYLPYRFYAQISSKLPCNMLLNQILIFEAQLCVALFTKTFLDTYCTWQLLILHMAACDYLD